MYIKLTKYQKNKLVGFKILKEEDYDKLCKGTYMKFYNLENNQISAARFNRLHCNIIIIGNNKNNDERIFI